MGPKILNIPPKIGIEFLQGSIGAIRSSLATSYDAWRRRATSPLKLDTADIFIHPSIHPSIHPCLTSNVEVRPGRQFLKSAPLLVLWRSSAAR